MANVHRYTTRNLRPHPTEEWEPAKAAVEGAGTNINRVLRAVLRWVAANPHSALRTLRPYLDQVDQDKPRSGSAADTN